MALSVWASSSSPPRPWIKTGNSPWFSMIQGKIWGKNFVTFSLVVRSSLRKENKTNRGNTLCKEHVQHWQNWCVQLTQTWEEREGQPGKWTSWSWFRCPISWWQYRIDSWHGSLCCYPGCRNGVAKSNIAWLVLHKIQHHHIAAYVHWERSTHGSDIQRFLLPRVRLLNAGRVRWWQQATEARQCSALRRWRWWRRISLDFDFDLFVDGLNHGDMRNCCFYGGHLRGYWILFAETVYPKLLNCPFQGSNLYIGTWDRNEKPWPSCDKDIISLGTCINII